LAAVALLSVMAGAGQVVLPSGALASPPDPATGRSQGTLSKGKVRPGPDTLVFSTAQSQFDPGIYNQGWWSERNPNDDANDNYVVGPLEGEYRNFFTFDVSALNKKHVTSATLRVNTASVTLLNGSEVLKLSDVSTDTATLNENSGTNPEIFSDLGTGAVYGTFSVSAVGNDQQLSLELNKVALHDLKHASKHAPDGFFSVGGSLLNAGLEYEYLFGNSGHLPVELVVHTR